MLDKDNINKITIFFNQYGWNFVQQSESTLVSRFESEDDIVFTLYANMSDDWLILTISPLVANLRNDCRMKVFHYLAQLNYHAMFVKFSIDSSEDVILAVELPLSGLTYETFVVGLEALCFYAGDQFQVITELGTNSKEPLPKFVDFD